MNTVIHKSLVYKSLALAAVSFVLDQASKYAIAAALPPYARVKITITPFMDFIHIRNSGISYGLLSNMGAEGRWLLAALTLGVITICCIWLARAQDSLRGFALGLIIGGGAGNLWDRLIHGAVVDFISLHAFGYYWYVFNLADVWLTFGIILFFWAEIMTNKDDKQK